MAKRNADMHNYTSAFRVRLDNATGNNRRSGRGIGRACQDAQDSTQQQPLRLTSSVARPTTRQSPNRTSSRLVLSCHLCRARKQKCDRLLPCGTCIRRGDSALCRFESTSSSVGAHASTSAAPTPLPPARPNVESMQVDSSDGSCGQNLSVSLQATSPSDSGHGQTDTASSMRQEAQARLQRLEEMVHGLISRATSSGRGSGSSQQGKLDKEQTAAKNGAPATKHPTLTSGHPESRLSGSSYAAVENVVNWPVSPPEIITESESSLSAGPVATMLGQTPFPGATNWAAVLDSIRDIQSYLGETNAMQLNGKQSSSNSTCEDGLIFEAEVTDEDVDALMANAGTKVPQLGRPAVAPLQNPACLESVCNGVTNLGKMHHLEAGVPDSPPYDSFRLAEPDGILSAICTVPEPASSDQLVSPTTSDPYFSHPLPRYLADAIARLPPRFECDRFMAVYFQASYMTGPFVHTGQFQRSYSRFWQSGNPTEANASSPLLWMSMLASVLSIGAAMEGRRQLAWVVDQNPGQSKRDVQDANHNSSSASFGEFLKKDRAGEPSNDDLTWASRLRKLSSSCLLAGDYLAGRPLAVEALLLNTHVRFMQGQDSDAAQWATFGVVVRLAQRLGYHQVDAPGGARLGIGGRKLTPFEEEMRRRVWYFVESFDLLYSFQFGMPTILHEDEVATDPPRNLRDDDFDETMQDLPPARPPSDYTVALFFSIKLKLIRILRRVMRVVMWRKDKANELDTQSYKTVVTRITQELRWSYTTLPAQLRMPKHIRDCPFGDTTPDIMHRLAIEMMHHKAVCILLRNSLSRTIGSEKRDSGTEGEFTAAETEMQRRACLVSALRILDLHTEFQYETCPGSKATASGDFPAGISPPDGCRGAGRLTTDRHLLSPLAMQNFLLAATILCLDLIEESRDDRTSKDSHKRMPGENETASKTTTAVCDATATSGTNDLNVSLFAPFIGSDGSNLEERAANRSAKIEALRTAYELWHERRLSSRDAARAAQILGAIVTKISAEEDACSNGNDTAGSLFQADDESPGWGRWDLAARELRIKQHEEDVRRHRAERSGKANETANFEEGNQSAATWPHTPNWPRTTTGRSTTGTPYQTQQLPLTRPPPPHNSVYEWAEPGPFDALLSDPQNIDWTMVDGFLLDRQLDMDAGGSVWSAELMALEN
ncbi:hypothetical protein SEPCBS119000_000254 [Sporothrix epigloea]|uniref:Zn(2)-C6 fungal-type domain-containing protein n=1 Tax=Sporothrix epigloea TaxID=1892477 RepID=A0ABP0D4I0_9PEZI